MAGKLQGRNAVVTGAGRGIGRAVAMLLAQEGANVVVNDPGVNSDGTGHDNGPADQVVAEIKAAGGNAVANYDTVATFQGGENMVRQCADTFGRIDILMNVAGILRDRMIFNMSEEEWDAVIAVHLKGHFNTIQPASILMRQQRYGRIVNFSSISGLRGISGQSNYGAAKAGIAGLTRVVARDLGKYGVTCNAIAPGAATRLTATVPDSARQLRAATQAQPTAPPPVQVVPATPEHVAPMTVWLCTDDAWNVNGKIFHVAGGIVSLAHEETPVQTIQKDGKWTLEELVSVVPGQLMHGIMNPAPPPADLDVPGRPVGAKG
ncbi:MAG TPA: SDR family oxidoreductase [Dehalococcoidia bacterium]|jgi:NAD(P)-dependent dehydrogenase (short-subunit alcohol dehydrogenase family)|nr:SDR family oxidoreductase [Dehalococcoidia bacterium]